MVNSVDKIKSPVGLCKTGILIFWSGILPIGLYSYYNSSWTRSYVLVPELGYVRGDQLCDIGLVDKCPDVLMERYFVFMIITSSLLSLFGMIVFLSMDLSANPFRKIDIGFHLGAAILLLVAGSLYILSAELTYDSFGGLAEAETLNFRRPEKIISGALTVIQSLLYGVTGFLIVKTS